MCYLILTSSGAAFGSFIWGMLRFFRRPTSGNPEVIAVSLAGVLSLAWHLAVLVACRPERWREGAALAMYLASTALFWSAVRACGNQPLTAIGEADQPTRLVQSGPYRRIRHPFYTAYMIAWTAGWVVSGNPWLLLSLAVMVTAYVRAMRREEAKFAQSPLWAEYAEYRQRAGMFLPRITGSIRLRGARHVSSR